MSEAKHTPGPWDTADIKVGDTVHVRGTILQSDIEGRLWFTAGGINGWVRPSTIVHVEPRPLAVGDHVTTPNDPAVWKIIGIDDDRAWCRLGTCRATYALTNLRRVP